jgi:NAD+ synthase (glutamine-hydrolysing)
MPFRIALAQCDATLGDLARNLQSHGDWIARARSAGADLLVFPELALTGYLLQDLVPEVSVERDHACFAELGRAAGSMALALSGIEESKDHGQYIASFFVEDGVVRHVHRKVYLANYGVFDEARYVGAGRHVRCAQGRVGKVGLVLCEDAWHPSLVNVMLLDGASLLVIQVASPVRDLTRGELPSNARTWMDTLRTYARLYGTYIAFCNRVGTEDGLVFWGHSCVLGPDGEIVASGPLYDEELVVADIDLERVREARLSNPVLREEKIDVTVRELQRLLQREGERP